MLDTVVLRSPAICEGTAAAVERQLRTRMGVYNATGEVEYEFCSGSLPGSWSSSVALTVSREEWVSVPRTVGKGHDVVKRPCEPFLRLEGSVHKAMLGHNVYGGPQAPAAGCRWFLADVSERLSLELPESAGWQVMRIDWAEAFELGSYEACADYIRALALARYPRRKVRRYGDECVFFGGTTTAFKVYHKGPEFHKHDRKRLAAGMEFGLSFVEGLQTKAHRVLRLEVSIKQKQLQADHGKRPLIGEVTRQYLERVHDRESLRVMQEGRAEMDQVRTADAVEDRLLELYGQRMGASLYSTWLRLSTKGESQTRARMGRANFYKHKKLLKEAGVSWVGTDVFISDTSAIPADFSVSRDSRYRMRDEEPSVTARLAAYAA